MFFIPKKHLSSILRKMLLECFFGIKTLTQSTGTTLWKLGIPIGTRTRRSRRVRIPGEKNCKRRLPQYLRRNLETTEVGERVGADTKSTEPKPCRKVSAQWVLCIKSCNGGILVMDIGNGHFSVFPGQ